MMLPAFLEKGRSVFVWSLFLFNFFFLININVSAGMHSTRSCDLLNTVCVLLSLLTPECRDNSKLYAIEDA